MQAVGEAVKLFSFALFEFLARKYSPLSKRERRESAGSRKYRGKRFAATNAVFPRKFYLPDQLYFLNSPPLWHLLNCEQIVWLQRHVCLLIAAADRRQIDLQQSCRTMLTVNNFVVGQFSIRRIGRIFEAAPCANQVAYPHARLEWIASWCVDATGD